MASQPTGPFVEQFQIIPPWAHNPEAILTPDGTVAVFTLGNGIQINGVSKPQLPLPRKGPR